MLILRQYLEFLSSLLYAINNFTTTTTDSVNDHRWERAEFFLI